MLRKRRGAHERTFGLIEIMRRLISRKKHQRKNQLFCFVSQKLKRFLSELPLYDFFLPFLQSGFPVLWVFCSIEGRAESFSKFKPIVKNQAHLPIKKSYTLQDTAAREIRSFATNFTKERLYSKTSS